MDWGRRMRGSTLVLQLAFNTEIDRCLESDLRHLLHLLFFSVWFSILYKIAFIAVLVPFISINHILVSTQVRHLIVSISCNVVVGPKLRHRPRNVVARVNSDHEFICDVYANPAPTLYWLKDGANLTITDYVRVVNSRTLRILGLLLSDAGMYQCMAVAGNVGSLQAAAQLVVQSAGMYLTL